MTDSDREEWKNKYWNPFDSFMKWLLGPEYREQFGEIGREYINTNMEDFRYKYIPDKGPAIDEISGATGDIIEIMDAAGVQTDKPELHWAEVYLETLDANLPPYMELLKRYKGKGASKMHYASSQLGMIYGEAARSRTANMGRWFRLTHRNSLDEGPDLKAIAIKVNYQLRPHFESVRREVMRYGGKSK